MAKLFHALVAIGTGICASNCGGIVVGTTGKPDEASGGSGAGGNPGGSVGGSGVGGAPLGGSSAGGITALGGVPANPSPVPEPLPDAGTLAQWDCTAVFGGCGSRGANQAVDPYLLSSSCPVDPSRPRSAADCGPNLWFQCTAARYGDAGVGILVDCTCAPMTDAGCACPPGFLGRERPSACHGHSMTCGCAYTGILH